MSKFSEKCKEFLQESGMSVYELSKISGIERTSLHRMVNGQRLPSQDVVNQFCTTVRLSIKDCRELMELYQEEKIGTEKYQNRKYIREIFANLTDLETTLTLRPSAFENYPPLPVSNRPLKVPSCTMTTFQTQNLLDNILEYLFSSDSQHTIYTNLPVTSGDFITSLRRFFYIYQGNVKIYHFLPILSSPVRHGKVNYNLQILNHILPLALSPYDSYMPYYSYGRVAETDAEQILFPYYFVTEEYVIEISGDLKFSLVHSTPAHLHIYQKHVSFLLNSMQPLIISSSSKADALDFYRKCEQTDNKATYAIQSSPGIKWMNSKPSDLLKNLTPLPEELLPFKEQIAPFLDNLFSRKNVHYFTVQGLDYFCKHGKLPGQLSVYFPALSVENRILCLKKLVIHFMKQQSSLRIFRATIDYPMNLYTEIYDVRSILFAQIYPDHSRFKFCYITESSLCHALQDYFENAEEIGLLLTYEESVKLLKHRIKELEKELP